MTDVEGRVVHPPHCTIDHCERPHYARGLCTRHYQLKRSHERGAKPNRPNGSSQIRDDRGNKQCVSCQLWLPVTSFATHKGTLDQLQVRCRSCSYIARHYTQYRLTPEKIAAIMQQQKHRCAICTDDISKHYVVDHSHDCCPGIRSCGDCVRGFLCDRCNLGLGSFRDSPEYLEAASSYLKGRASVE